MAIIKLASLYVISKRMTIILNFELSSKTDNLCFLYLIILMRAAWSANKKVVTFEYDIQLEQL